jgi:hypothetical protein
MFACRILSLLITVTSPILIPIQLATTGLGGCLVAVTFGLALLPMTAIWLAMMGLLLGSSWLWKVAARAGALGLIIQIPLALIGVPLAFLSSTFAALMPSMGEMESRVAKLQMAGVWPFSIHLWMIVKGAEEELDPSEIDQLARALRIAGWPQIAERLIREPEEDWV